MDFLVAVAKHWTAKLCEFFDFCLEILCFIVNLGNFWVCLMKRLEIVSNTFPTNDKVSKIQLEKAS